MRRLARTVGSILVAVALPVAAGAQAIPPGMPPSPSAVEGAGPAAPMVVLQDDADRILRSLAPPHPTSDPAPLAPAEAPITIPLDAFPPSNATSRFLFEDVTDRPAVPVRSLAERRAAVEAVRQSIDRGVRRP